MTSTAQGTDGGPAFPVPASEHSQGGHFEQYGMSLRDWFAGQALAGIGTWMPNGFTNLNSAACMDARSKWAFAQADAMIAESERADK